MSANRATRGADTVLIVGASARAAARSAQRAGLVVAAIDRFGDVDLADCGRHIVLDRFPRGLICAAAELPLSHWLYTGPLENFPRTIAQIQASRPLLGNGAAVVRRIRNPFRIAQALLRTKLPCPEVRPSLPAPREEHWMWKPYRSGGGVGVKRWAPGFRQREVDARTKRGVWQRFIPGCAVGAVFIGANGNASLIGTTRQLVGTDWCGANGYQYAGSIGPVALSALENEDLRRAGQMLAAEFRLKGLFCVDAILHARRAWLVEVNPRYSASVEILERSLDQSLIVAHIEATRGAHLSCPTCSENQVIHGKAIVFAQRDLIAPQLCTRVKGTIADIPHPGSLIRAGQPVLTVFAEGKSDRQVEKRLRDRATEIEKWPTPSSRSSEQV